MEFRILGPLQVFDGGREVDVGSGRHRTLLALLLLASNEVVPADRLVDELWEGRPPPSAAKSLQNAVVRLRKLLGDRIVTRNGGYLVRVESGELDADRFIELVELSRRQEGGERAETLRQALAMWRGGVLADALPDGLERPEARRFEELRDGALEARIDADLEAGARGELVGELEALVGADPYRERPRAQLMLVLYRSGRQADALAVYRETRRILADELGLEPSPALRELERAILAHDADLDPPKPPPSEAAVEPRRRRRLVIGIVTAAVAAGAAAILAWPEGASSIRVPVNSVAVIDPGRNRVVGSIPVGSRPADLAVGFHSLWVANLDDGTVSRINLRRRALVRSVPVGSGMTGLATGDGSVWVGTAAGVVRRIDPAFDTVVQPISSPSYARYDFEIDQSLQRASPIATGDGAVWFGHSSSVSRIDPQAGQAVGSVGVGLSPSAIAVGDGAVWVADSVGNTVTVVRPSGATTTVPVGDGPSALAVGEGGVWVADLLSNSATEIDPATAAVLMTIPVGEAPTGIAVGAGSIWVANSRSDSVTRIDPRSGRVTATIALNASPSGIAFAAGRIWVTVQPSNEAGAGAAIGGVLRVNAPAEFDSIDPAQASDSAALQVEYATCAKLLDYPDAAAPAGSRLLPEAAAAMPAIGDGGRIYTFRVRPGFRFSPPSGQRVTAETFRYSIERAMRVNPDAARLLGDVTNVSARGDSLTVRLRSPAPDLPARLAYPYFCAVPTDTPPTLQRVQPIPSAGPYYIASYSPGQSLVLRRNPDYHGSRPRRLGEIAYTFGVDPAKTVQEIRAGSADYAAPAAFTNALPPAAIPRLLARYGPDSPAARHGDQRYFENPALGEIWLALNPNRPPFSAESIRRAVAFAIDRPALSLDTGYAFRPDDHLMPPGLPGYEDVHYYPTRGPNLKKARTLMHGRHVVAIDYTCTGCSNELLTNELAQIGIDVVSRAFPAPEMLRLVKTAGEPVDIFDGGTSGGYADPSEFLNSVLVGRYIAALAPHDRGTLHALAAAERLSGAARARAYGRLDVELARRAVLVPLGYMTEQDFFSVRVGCRVYQPVYGMDLGALCISR